jgi:hypothetical protein
MVTLRDAPGGTVLSEETVEHEGCFHVDFGLELAPGMQVSVDDGTSPKELTLDSLSIDAIDPASNVVSGTATPDETFNVDAFTEDGWQGLDVTSDGAGDWSVDFDDIGVDIDEYTHVGANIGDDDGDQTIFDTQLQTGGDLVITDPQDFAGRVGESTVIDFEDIDASPVNNTWVGRDPFDGAHYAGLGATFSNPNGYDLYVAPGGLFWNESNSLSVAQFPFDDNADDGNDDDLVVDLDPARIAVGFTLVDNGSHDEWIEFLDADGEIVDRVNMPGDYTEFRAFAGIISPDRPIARIRVVELAFDGDDVDYDDFILVDTLVPPPFEANLAFDNISGCGYAPGATLDVTVEDAPGGILLFASTPTVSPDGCFDTGYEVDLVPGRHVTVADGSASRELTLAQLSIDGIDVAADTAFGTAPPDTTFNVDFDTAGDGSGWVGLDVTSDAAGNWVADFGAEGLDLGPGSHVGANIADDDGDQTAYDFVALVEEVIQAIEEDVVEIIEEQIISQKEGDKLIKKLDAAQGALEDGTDQPSAARLVAKAKPNEIGETKAAQFLKQFIHEVEKLVDGDRLPANIAEGLIGPAEEVIDYLESGH